MSEAARTASAAETFWREADCSNHVLFAQSVEEAEPSSLDALLQVHEGPLEPAKQKFQRALARARGAPPAEAAKLYARATRFDGVSADERLDAALRACRAFRATRQFNECKKLASRFLASAADCLELHVALIEADLALQLGSAAAANAERAALRFPAEAKPRELLRKAQEMLQRSAQQKAEVQQKVEAQQKTEALQKAEALKQLSVLGCAYAERGAFDESLAAPQLSDFGELLVDCLVLLEQPPLANGLSRLSLDCTVRDVAAVAQTLFAEQLGRSVVLDLRAVQSEARQQLRPVDSSATLATLLRSQGVLEKFLCLHFTAQP